MPRQFFCPSGIGELDRHEGAGVQLMSGRVFLRACECGLKKSFEPKAGAKRSQRLRAGHRRSKSEGQKGKQIERFCRRSEAEFSSGDTAGGRAAGQADAVGDPTDRVECLTFTHKELKVERCPFPRYALTGTEIYFA